MLDGVPLQLTVTCPSCHQPIHVQGLTEVELCPSCSHALSVPVEQWLGWFSADEMAEAVTLPEGEGRSMSIMGAYNAQAAYGHRRPRCQKCKTDVPLADLAALAEVGHHACACGERIGVRAANDLARVLIPGARWVVGEGAVGTDTREPQAATEPVMFSCLSCGGGLKVDGSTRTVTCQFCSNSNYLPDGLWLRLHPPRTVRTFTVVFDGAGDDGSLPPALLERLARAEDDEVRARAAGTRGLPAALLAELATDAEDDVRAAVATNPDCPPDVLATLATDDEEDVREAVAAHPSLPADLLARLVEDADWHVRRAAVAHPDVTEAQLVKRLADESDSDVLEAIGKRPELGPRALLALASHDSPSARLAAASHPDATPEVLRALAATGDEDALVALSARDDLPSDVLLTLGGHDSPRVTALVVSRPAYLEATTQRRNRRLMLAGGVLLVLGCLGAGGAGLAAVAVLARMALG